MTICFICKNHLASYIFCGRSEKGDGFILGLAASKPTPRNATSRIHVVLHLNGGVYLRFYKNPPEIFMRLLGSV